MADLKSRMAKQVTDRPTEEPAFRQAPPTFEKRVTLDLTAADHATLKDLAHEMRANSMADVLRAAITAMRADQNTAAAVQARLPQ